MANFNLNKVILGGRLCSEPELKTTPNGISVITFSLAVNRRPDSSGKVSADFIYCTAWRGTAEFVAKYFRKGSSLCICGQIQTRSYTDKNNVKRYATDVIADEVYFVDAKGEHQTTAVSPDVGAGAPDAGAAYASPPAASAPYVPSAYGPQSGSASAFEALGDDSDLPF